MSEPRGGAIPTNGAAEVGSIPSSIGDESLRLYDVEPSAQGGTHILGLLLIDLVLISVVVSSVVLSCALRRRDTGLGPVAEVAVAWLASWTAMTVAATLGLFVGIGVGPSWALSSIAALVVSLRFFRPPYSDVLGLGRSLFTSVRSSETMWAIVGIGILVQVVLSVMVLSTFGDVGWDAAWFHLPIVGSTIQEGSLFGFPDLNPWMSYPGFIETQATLLGLAFDSVRIASVIQLGFWIWLIIFVAGFVSHRSSKGAALAAAFVVAAVPTAWLQTRTLYVDLAFGALLATASIAVVLAFQHKHRLLLLIAALLTGSLFAIKVGPAGALPVALAVAVVAFSSKDMRRVAVLVVVFGILPAIPFLARNTIEWGNPLYPISLTEATDSVSSSPQDAPYSVSEMLFISDTLQRPESLQGLEAPEAIYRNLVTSPISETVRAATDGDTPPSRYLYRYDAREGGYGTAWLALVVVAGVAATIVLIPNPTISRPRRGKAVLTSSLVALAALSLALTQAPWWPRYTLGVCFLIAIASGIVVGSARWSTIAAIALTVPIAMFTISATESNGGLQYWNEQVATDELALIEATGLSVFTPGYAPVVFDDVSSLYVFDYSPQFPAGLWGNDWGVDVSLHDLDELSSGLDPSECPEGVLIPTEHLSDIEGWLIGADARVGNLVPWNDQGQPLVWLTGITCRPV